MINQHPYRILEIPTYSSLMAYKSEQCFFTFVDTHLDEIYYKGKGIFFLISEIKIAIIYWTILGI